MILNTPIKLSPLKAASYNTKYMMLGSCFAQNMGAKLLDLRFNTVLNPYGILYNPASIALAIERLLIYKPFAFDDLNVHNGLHFSFAHHGAFSNSNASVCLENINKEYLIAAEAIKHTDVFIITFGSSLIYQLREEQTNKHQSVVANCHKLPAKTFLEHRMSVSEIVDTYNILIAKIRTINANAQFIFSVSPVRYLGYGAQQSQCIKATLLLACEEICANNTNTHYFPAYEIMMDELRDYRFYASDMIHPNEIAISYIWERFSEWLFSKETLLIIPEVEKINRALNHKPLHPYSREFEIFKQNTKQKIKDIKEKYPLINF